MKINLYINVECFRLFYIRFHALFSLTRKEFEYSGESALTISFIMSNAILFSPLSRRIDILTAYGRIISVF